jgi:alpha-ketoglutarate-dependent taurine dioxygenase
LLVSAKRICWPGRKALVIDNWRVLHGRERCSDMTRVLFRFYRGGKNELGA